MTIATISKAKGVSLVAFMAETPSARSLIAETVIQIEDRDENVRRERFDVCLASRGRWLRRQALIGALEILVKPETGVVFEDELLQLLTDPPVDVLVRSTSTSVPVAHLAAAAARAGSDNLLEFIRRDVSEYCLRIRRAHSRPHLGDERSTLP